MILGAWISSITKCTLDHLPMPCGVANSYDFGCMDIVDNKVYAQSFTDSYDFARKDVIDNEI